MSLVVGISNQVVVHDVKNINDYMNITDASLTVEIKDSLGDLVAGEFWPVDLTYSVIDYQGAYRANLSPSLDVVAGESYTIEVNGLDSEGNQLINICSTTAQKPGCNGC